MQISPVSLPVVSFKSHKKEVKEAQDIMRKAQSTFPMVSSTRIMTNYDLINKPAPKQKLIDDIQEEICLMREDADYKQRLAGYVDNPYRAFVEGIKRIKKGNCLECAVSAAAGLYANGYSADVVSLYMNHSFINKKTGRVEYKEGAYLDHAFAVTDMGKRGQKIILDPWLGLCGDWKDVNPKFHSLFDSDSKVIQYKDKNREEFIKRLKMEYSPYDISDYEERLGFSYRPLSFDVMDKDSAKKFFRENYPTLVLNA